MNLEPLAFMSYARADDKHDNHRISEFCQLIAAEISAQTGKHFHIFQDTTDIKPGEQWQKRLDDEIDNRTFLIPIITPRFFESEACAQEVKRFISHEQQLGRDDLIIPIYYITADAIENPHNQNEIAQLLALRQFINWRDNRFLDFDSPNARAKFADLALQIIQVINRQPLNTTTTYSPFTPKPIVTNHQTEHKNKPMAKEYVVDCYHQGDFTTIGEAIEAAEPGSVILVREGYYPESLKITKPLKIIGQGHVENITVESHDGDALYFDCNIGLVQNLSFKNHLEKNACIFISSGQLTLEKCDISSLRSHGIRVNYKAIPKISNNKIHHCRLTGIYYENEAQGFIEYNEVYANKAGIGIRNQHTSPTIRHNQIYNNHVCGIIIADQAAGVIENNDISHNESENIRIHINANPTIKHNKIHHSNQYGIWIADKSTGLVEHNHLYANKKKAILISADSTPTIGENQIEENEN